MVQGAWSAQCAETSSRISTQYAIACCTAKHVLQAARALYGEQIGGQGSMCGRAWVCQDIGVACRLLARWEWPMALRAVGPEHTCRQLGLVVVHYRSKLQFCLACGLEQEAIKNCLCRLSTEILQARESMLAGPQRARWHMASLLEHLALSQGTSLQDETAC